jgi:site-specific DNA-methyltransferase (adenine-specific)
MNKIFNEDCLITMDRTDLKSKVDLVITSPPYNTSRANVTNDKYSSRYDVFFDKKTDREYIDWTLDIFNGYDKILKKDGCILYNVSYSSENTTLMWLLIAELIQKSNFMTADCIVWKKGNAIPNNVSKNKLTRIIEYVFVFCRKSEFKTFDCNKKVISTSKKGQNIYENIYNFFEARNNDGSNPLNKATFSTEMVTKLLDIYAKPNSLIYDSFMGVGTTAKASLINGYNYVGSEISNDQIELFNKWLEENKI